MITGGIKLRSKRWTGHVARMGNNNNNNNNNNKHRVSIRKPQGKRQLGRPRRRFEDKIKRDLDEI